MNFEFVNLQYYIRNVLYLSMKLIAKPFLPFWIFTLALMLVLTLPSLIQDGMFNDALLYTSVSRNLAHGMGSFWFPYFDPYNIIGLNSFHEQPPLAFGIQSLFFRLLGDSMYTERIYTLLMLALSAFLIKKIWNEIFCQQTEYQAMGWLSWLLWISIPVCFWSYTNNMHENTMGVFILGACLVMYKALKREQLMVAYWVLAGLLLGLAALTKGFPGLFPLSFPFLYWAITHESTFRKMLFQTLLLIATLVVVGVALYLYTPSHDSLSIYLFKRAFARIQGAHSVDSRFFIVFRLFSELLPQLCFTIVVYLIARSQKIKFMLSGFNKTTLLFFALGLCGSLPLMLTKVQNGFYMVGALPYFAIAFALLNVHSLYIFISNIKASVSKNLLKGSVLLLFAVLFFSFSKIGGTVRDKSIVHDVHLIGKNIPAFTAMGCKKDIYERWEIACYFVRYYNISLNKADTNQYFLTLKYDSIGLPNHLLKMEMDLEMFDLYKRNTGL